MIFSASNKLLWQEPLPRAIREIARVGYGGVEIWGGHPQTRPWRENDHDQIADALVASGLSSSVHAIIKDINISSDNPPIREISLNQVEHCLDLAADIGADCVVVHPGKKTSSKDPVEPFLDNLLEGIERLIRYASERGVEIKLENMEARRKEFFVETKLIVDVLSSFRRDRLGLTFDFAHANTHTDPFKMFEKCKDFVDHIHLSDNDGSPDRSHKPLGEGTMDIQQILEGLQETGYEGHIVVEGYVPDRAQEVLTKNYRGLARVRGK